MAIEAMTQTTIRQAEVSWNRRSHLSHRNDPKLAWATPLDTWPVALVFSRCGHASVPIGYSAARRCGVEAVMIHGDGHPSSR